MFSTLDTRFSNLGSSPGHGHCVILLGDVPLLFQIYIGDT